MGPFCGHEAPGGGSGLIICVFYVFFVKKGREETEERRAPKGRGAQEVRKREEQSPEEKRREEKKREEKRREEKRRGKERRGEEKRR